MHDRYTTLVQRCIERSATELLREYIKGTLQPYIVSRETNLNHFVHRKVLLEIRTECAINNWAESDCQLAIRNANKFFKILEDRKMKITILPEQKQKGLTQTNSVLDFT